MYTFCFSPLILSGNSGKEIPPFFYRMKNLDTT